MVLRALSLQGKEKAQGQMPCAFSIAHPREPTLIVAILFVLC